MRFSSSKKSNDKKGRWAERYACMILTLKGYRIIARRLKIAGCELDILARRRRLLVAVEVKYRPTLQEAILAVSVKQRRRIEIALIGWISSRQYKDQEMRCDVLAVSKWGKYRHLKNAW